MRQLPLSICLLAAACPGVLAGDPPPDPPRTRTLSAPAEVADRLLAEAESSAQAARRWLREYLSKEAIDERAAAARAALTDRFDRALEEARVAHERTLGLFIFTPGSPAGNDPWRRLTDGEHPGEHLVLLIHGLDEGGTIWDDAAPAISGAGHTVLRFNYPNDQPIAASADALASALRELRARGVRAVDIIGHSMGGLLARDVLTRPAYYAGDARGNGELPAVPRLIMLGTPNQGSPMASLRGAMEIRDQFVRWLASEDKSASALLGFMVDGDGEAGLDLLPNSAFLNELNARPMPAGVAITTIVGEIASGGRARIANALDSPYIRRVIGEENVRRWKEGTNGAWDEIGDGAVPASSARLEGVADLVVVHADHRSMVRTLEPLAAARDAVGAKSRTPPAIPVILDRLAHPPPPVGR